MSRGGGYTNLAPSQSAYGAGSGLYDAYSDTRRPAQAPATSYIQPGSAGPALLPTPGRHGGGMMPTAAVAGGGPGQLPAYSSYSNGSGSVGYTSGGVRGGDYPRTPGYPDLSGGDYRSSRPMERTTESIHSSSHGRPMAPAAPSLSAVRSSSAQGASRHSSGGGMSSEPMHRSGSTADPRRISNTSSADPRRRLSGSGSFNPMMGNRDRNDLMRPGSDVYSSSSGLPSRQVDLYGDKAYPAASLGSAPSQARGNPQRDKALYDPLDSFREPDLPRGGFSHSNDRAGPWRYEDGQIRPQPQVDSRGADSYHRDGGRSDHLTDVQRSTPRGLDRHDTYRDDSRQGSYRSSGHNEHRDEYRGRHGPARHDTEEEWKMRETTRDEELIMKERLLKEELIRKERLIKEAEEERRNKQRREEQRLRDQGLRRENELRREQELRRDKEMRREQELKKEELRKVEELKRLELKRQEEQRKKEQERKIDEQRKREREQRERERRKEEERKKQEEKKRKEREEKMRLLAGLERQEKILVEKERQINAELKRQKRQKEEEERRKEEEERRLEMIMIAQREKEEELQRQIAFREQEIYQRENSLKEMEWQTRQREKELEYLEQMAQEDLLMKQRELELLHYKEIALKEKEALQAASKHHEEKDSRHSRERSRPSHSKTSSGGSNRDSRRSKSSRRDSSRPDLKKRTIRNDRQALTTSAKGASRDSVFSRLKTTKDVEIPDNRGSAFERLGEKVTMKSRLGGKFARKAVPTQKGMSITVQNSVVSGAGDQVQDNEVVSIEEDETFIAEQREKERKLKERLMREQSKGSVEVIEVTENKGEVTESSKGEVTQSSKGDVTMSSKGEATESIGQGQKRKLSQTKEGESVDLDKVVIKRRSDKAKTPDSTGKKTTSREKSLTVKTPRNLVGTLAMVLKEIPKPGVEAKVLDTKEKEDIKKKFKAKFANENLPDRILELGIANVNYDQGLGSLLISNLLKQIQEPTETDSQQQEEVNEVDQDEYNKLDYEVDE